ncbi:MAG: hypothetical protein ACM3SR_08885 [Ignavibacteriales bacterium]
MDREVPILTEQERKQLYQDRLEEIRNFPAFHVRSIKQSGGWKSEATRLEKFNDKIELPVKKINPLTNPEFYLERLKKDPWLIATDAYIQLAIRVLQGACLIGTKEKSEYAKKLLRQAGISAFIPKEAQERMTENQNLKFLQSQPYTLKELVEYFASMIVGKLPKRQIKDKLYLERKIDAIEKLFKEFFGEEMPEELLFVEYDKDIRSAALAFISHRYSIPFESLKKFYYNVARHSTRMNSKVELIYPF